MQHKTSTTPESVWQNPIHFLAFGFGSGALPFAPGTFGTLAAIPLYLILQPLSLIFYLIVLAVMIGVGCWICDVTEKALGEHDHSGIVWDEFAGYILTMTLAPPGWLWVVLGFCLFRLFDIWKPWPIRTLDVHIPGGIGVMVDDLLAGVYALIVLQLVVWIV